jgi:putative transposase
MRNYLAELKPGGYYHVYNSANGREKLFTRTDNYRYFLSKYFENIAPIAETYCYCLMSNHFHFMIRCKDDLEIERFFLERCNNVNIISAYKKGNNAEREKILTDFNSRQFSNFFNGYTQAFNKQEKRRGALFMRPFKRILLDTDEYKRSVVIYIHNNPVEAGIIKNPRDYAHSSFRVINDILETGNLPDNFNLQLSGITDLFGTIENFNLLHSHQPTCPTSGNV